MKNRHGFWCFCQHPPWNPPLLLHRSAQALRIRRLQPPRLRGRGCRVWRRRQLGAAAAEDETHQGLGGNQSEHGEFMGKIVEKTMNLWYVWEKTWKNWKHYELSGKHTWDFAKTFLDMDLLVKYQLIWMFPEIVVITPTSCIWLVVSTPLKNINQLGWLFPIYGNIKSMLQSPPTRHVRIFQSTILGIFSFQENHHGNKLASGGTASRPGGLHGAIPPMAPCGYIHWRCSMGFMYLPIILEYIHTYR